MHEMNMQIHLQANQEDMLHYALISSSFAQYVSNNNNSFYLAARPHSTFRKRGVTNLLEWLLKMFVIFKNFLCKPD